MLSLALNDETWHFKWSDAKEDEFTLLNSSTKMNIMRKFLAGGGSGSSGQGQSEDGDGSTVTPIPRPEEQELLGLSHLKKLFNEYISPSHPLTEAEKEAKLYSMLPLFCKVSFWLNSFWFKTRIAHCKTFVSRSGWWCRIVRGIMTFMLFVAVKPPPPIVVAMIIRFFCKKFCEHSTSNLCDKRMQTFFK